MTLYNSGCFPQVRLRRLRENPGLRLLSQETRLALPDLICPVFVHDGQGIEQPIASLPGYFHYSLDKLAPEIRRIAALGLVSIILFGVISDRNQKDAVGSCATQPDALIAQAISLIKNVAPQLVVIADLCCCQYTDHGHCGVFQQQRVDNDATLALLLQQAIVLAQAGADVIAPSGMMDGVIGTLRTGLDKAGYSTPLLAYSAKYCSAFYGAFRQAVYSTPLEGDRQGYQMQPSNRAEALREVALDSQEGVDMIMVKPAGYYLDVIADIKRHYPAMPLVAYQVSGEYTMIQCAIQAGFLDAHATPWESLVCIKRAGANAIITYFAKTIAARLMSSKD